MFCYNLYAPEVRAFVWFFYPPSVVLRKWWNWQTHHLEGVAPKGVGVQIPPSAPLQIEPGGNEACSGKQI